MDIQSGLTFKPTNINHDKKYILIRKLIQASITATIFILIFLLLPNAVEAIATPTGKTKNTISELTKETFKDRGIQDAKINIVTMQGLSVAGKGNVWGYVNMLSRQDNLYVKPYLTKDGFNENKSFYTVVLVHEYGHILQKRLIEKASKDGNAYTYYSKLFELNALLAKEAPPVRSEFTKNNSLFFNGLETNADCILSSYSPYIKKAYYVDESNDGCNSRQIAIARSVREGDWPTEQNIEKWQNAIILEKAMILLQLRS